MNKTSTKPSSTNVMHVIPCAIGNERYAVDMSWIRTIQRTGALLMSPETKSEDAGFVGWLSSNEGDVPVFDMAYRLQRPFSMLVNNPQQRILILPASDPTIPGWMARGQPWGLLVDQVWQVLEIEKGYFAPVPAIAANPQTNVLEGVIALNDQLLLLLSPQQLHPDALPPQQNDDSAAKPKRLQPVDGVRPSPSLQSSPTNGASRQGGRLMIFSVEEQTQPTERPVKFGLSITQIVEIINPQIVTPVPTAPPFVLGLINWRNRPVPVLDLPQRIGLTPSTLPSNDHRRFAVVHDSVSGTLGCFPISTDVHVVQLPIKHQPSSRPLQLDSHLVHGIFELEEETLIVPNLKRVLLS